MGGLEIRFLGSGDAFGSGGRFQTCIFVRSADGRFLIDCGASSLIAMRRFGVDPLEIDAILLSHLHGDHFGGLPFLILDAQFRRRTRPLVIAGPPGVEARVCAAMEVLFPGSSRVGRKFSTPFVELSDRAEADLRPCAVTPFGVVHPSGAPPFALRVACGGKVIGYSGDTEWAEALIEAAHLADLFICEAYHFDKPIKYHLNYRTLMEHRQELRCRRLILTHMSEEMLGRLEGLDAEWAEDGKAIFL